MILNFIMGFSVAQAFTPGEGKKNWFQSPLMGLNGPRVSTPGVNAWAKEKSLKLGH